MVCPISVITKTLIFIQGVTFRSILFHDHTRVYITKPLVRGRDTNQYLIMVLLLGSLVYLAAFLSFVASEKSHSSAGFIRRAAHQKGNVKSQQGQQGQQSQQHVELTGTEQDNVCTDLQQKYDNKIPDGYQCSAYDVNKPEVALSTFQTHGIPVA